MIRNLNQMVELVAILWCMANFFGEKMRFSVYGVVVVITNLLICSGINQGILEKYFLVFTYCSLFLYGLIIFKGEIKTTLLNCFLTIVLIGILQMIVYLPIFYFFINRNGVGEFYDLLINIVSLVIIVFTSKRVKWKEFSDFLLRKNILLISIFVFTLIFLGRTLYQFKEREPVLLGEYLQLLCFLILFFFAINEWKKAKVDVERKKAQIEINRLYYAAYDELIVLIRERQHDLKNHISAIYGMIYTTDNYEELANMQKEYCKCILDRNEETKLLLAVGNPLIAGFMYCKIKEAEKHGINVKYKIEIEEPDVKVPEYEIIEMLGILFDNAIEALEKRETEKIIYINIFYINGKLDISVANRSEEFSSHKIEEFFHWNFSTKGNNHGIGLTKLKKMVHEKEGEIVVSNEIYESINFLQFEICLPLCYE